MFNTYCFPMMPIAQGGWTVRYYLVWNWLWSLRHPLHLFHKSDTVMEWAAMKTIFSGLPRSNPWTLCTRVEDLNHSTMLLLSEIFSAQRSQKWCTVHLIIIDVEIGSPRTRVIVWTSMHWPLDWFYTSDYVSYNENVKKSPQHWLKKSVGDALRGIFPC